MPGRHRRGWGGRHSQSPHHHRTHWRLREHRFPLSEAGVDEKVRLVTVVAGRRLLRRLADLGLTPGTEMTVRRAVGPLVLALGEGLIALGRGVARLVIVEKVDHQG
ncbi:MAG TPA: FeoA domain-containing protein [Acidimicrobiia bacterium]|nr:FeoA domain-containing protein [Acidimicrobiia bacterium]